MKKLLLIVFAAAMMSSCGDTIYDGAYVETFNVRVGTNQLPWVYVDEPGQGAYYSCRISMQEITPNIHNYGVVAVYLHHSSGRYEPLPYIRVEEVANTNDIWTTYITFEHEVGWMNIYYTRSDYDYGTNPERWDPGTYDLKVTLTL